MSVDRGHKTFQMMSFQILAFLATCWSDDINHYRYPLTLCPQDSNAALSQRYIWLSQGACICEFYIHILTSVCLLSVCLFSQTSNLSEAAQPPWTRRGQRRRPRGRAWRLQTGQGRERWPVRGQGWSASE